MLVSNKLVNINLAALLRLITNQENKQVIEEDEESFCESFKNSNFHGSLNFS